jgi:hypothetical protein
VDQKIMSIQKPARGKTTPASTAGSFKTYTHGVADLDLGDPGAEAPASVRPYADATPVDIDSELFRLYVEESGARTRAASGRKALRDMVATDVLKRGWRGTATDAEVIEYLDAIREEQASGAEIGYAGRRALRLDEEIASEQRKADAAARAAEPYNAEFEARGGWTRAFLVIGSNGHVHKHMDCSSCFKTGYDGAGNWREGTKYHWVTDLSGHDESEVVEAAGERACTVCYPSAPVDVLKQPTRLFTPDEVEQQKARVERQAAAEKRRADKIAKALTPDGTEFKIEWTEDAGGHDRDPVTGASTYSVRPRPRSERFKTEAAASQWLVQQMIYQRFYDNHTPNESQRAAWDSIVTAIAAKNDKSIEQVRAEIEKKVAAKAKRDGWTK